MLIHALIVEIIIVVPPIGGNMYEAVVEVEEENKDDDEDEMNREEEEEEEEELNKHMIRRPDCTHPFACFPHRLDQVSETRFCPALLGL